LQVIESSFVEMTEITKLVPFSAACEGVLHPSMGGDFNALDPGCTGCS